MQPGISIVNNNIVRILKIQLVDKNRKILYSIRFIRSIQFIY